MSTEFFPPAHRCAGPGAGGGNGDRRIASEAWNRHFLSAIRGAVMRIAGWRRWRNISNGMLGDIAGIKGTPSTGVFDDPDADLRKTLN